MRDLKSCRPISAMLTPSIVMLPSAASIKRNSESDNEDFPAPVRPTTPTCKENTQLNQQQDSKANYVYYLQLFKLINHSKYSTETQMLDRFSVCFYLPPSPSQVPLT